MFDIDANDGQCNINPGPLANGIVSCIDKSPSSGYQSHDADIDTAGLANSFLNPTGKLKRALSQTGEGIIFE